MILKKWTVSACIADPKEVLLCYLIFEKKIIEGEDRIIRENVTFFKALKTYFILSNMGVLSMFYKT